MAVHGCANFFAIGCMHALAEKPSAGLASVLNVSFCLVNSKILPKHAITKGLDRSE